MLHIQTEKNNIKGLCEEDLKQAVVCRGNMAMQQWNICCLC